MSNLTAWERWELASLDAEPLVAANTSDGASEASVTVSSTELEQLRETAHKEGYTAGYAAGQEDSRREAARLAQAADNLEHSLSQLDQAVADELLALAMEIARQVVRQEIKQHPEHLLNIIHEALSQLPHLHTTIFLHPDDASLVRELAGELLTHGGHRILDDTRLQRGDCLIESGHSQTDATVATRWRRVLATLGLSADWSYKEEKE